MTEIVADAGRCVGAGQCVLTDPDAFDQSDEDGTVVLLQAVPADDEALKRAQIAVEICPSRALSLTD
ncbi:ferredoxin [Actinoplanes philippinensis]|uniref:Ferredoxin n=1 Tax=Actinoplanes philippinensis TaxID=35752 RepID=A0A1I2I6I0_9ACTN|nr:ferredoxin [Actinoplanes philippinensis]GIE78632.1 ferredoxin [Actinoplanes philippinensis]SFF37223.1 ferredoxin [Actinoplanes philippinensis]